MNLLVTIPAESRRMNVGKDVIRVLGSPAYICVLQRKDRKSIEKILFGFWGVIKALLLGKVHRAGQTKLPENWLRKPTFGEFDVELLIRFERTTCSLRVSCSTG